jgi:hypothetical protein
VDFDEIDKRVKNNVQFTADSLMALSKLKEIM